MNDFLFWPYDELTLELSADQDVILVKTPWIEAAVAVTGTNKVNIQALATKFSHNQLAPSDMNLVQWFFKDFSKYPLCYILPSPKTSSQLDCHSMQDDRCIHGELVEFLSASLVDPVNQAVMAADDVSMVIKNVSRQTFEWDVTSALAFARIGDYIHPESLFSVVRRFHLLDVLENDRGKEAFRFIESLPSEDFRQAVSIVVRQNHYVTQKCQEALAPATHIAGQARAEVEHFLREENGHDLILNAAMKSLVPDPESLPVSAQTVALMQLLKFAGSRNFLAFAMVVDFFERSSYEKIDPLAQLLKKGGFEKAARQVNRHMEINDAGEHENVGCGFLRTMGPCELNYAKEAIRIAEAVSLVMNSMTGAAVDLYKNS